MLVPRKDPQQQMDMTSANQRRAMMILPDGGGQPWRNWKICTGHRSSMTSEISGGYIVVVRGNFVVVGCD